MVDVQGDVAGDALTFDAFVRRERLNSLRLAWFLTRDRQDAEDVVQLALLKVGQRFESLANPAAYLRVVVLNGCRQLARRRRTERDRAHLHSAETVAWMNTDIEVLSALAGLPYPLREVLVLRYWLDLADNEIAAEVGVRPATIRTRIHRALTLLRKEIDL